MTRTIGIDPGVTGAIASLGRDHGEAEVFDMPTVKNGTTSQLNAHALADLLRAIHLEHGISEVRIEQVNAMPARGKNGERRTAGAQSMFNFGEGAGVLRGVCAALGLRIRYVTPQTWKKRAGLLRKDKDEARARALELYPLLELHRKKDVGRADAVLIAHYGGA